MLTVGDLLYKYRNKQNITLDDAAKETRVSKRYLVAVERNDWSVFTSKVYITGILRTYSRYLNLDPDKVLAYFRRDYEKKEEVRFNRRLPSLNFLPDTSKIVLGALTLIVFFFCIYFGYQFYLYLRPPAVAILAPQQNVFRNTEKITIIGSTQKESTIRIFNEDIYPDQNGMFQYEFPLQKGRNTIDIHVTGANGKEAIVTQEYVLE